MHQKFLCTLLLTLIITVLAVTSIKAEPGPAKGEPRPAKGESSPAQVESKENKLDWLPDYATAMHRAKREGKVLLIVFCGSETEDCKACLEKEVLEDPEVQKRLGAFLLLKLTSDVRVDLGKEESVELLKHPTFREMCGKPGIAMIDFRDKEAEYYGHVVSTFPVLGNKPYTKSQMLTILGLPAGTLTQRTLIYAVRIHPEGPKSTEGDLSDYLVTEARSHSVHQARIRLQGHHQWESRFHRITSRLPFGLRATEVCAESWPNEGLLVAAIDCVRCWHYSSGHWRQVSAPHRLWGYDMRRGSNGIWYATGIFSQNR